jgi:DNA-binding LytR/AlgR family response regulator
MKSETCKILIVEDEALYAETLDDLVLESGYQSVGIANNAKSALRILKNKKPDLVLMDIGLQGETNGIELAQSIKEYSPEIPIIFITSFQDEKSFDEAKEVNPMAYLTKPIDNIQLRRSIELALAKTHREEHVFDVENQGILAKEYFFFKVNGVVKKVKISEIHSIEIQEKYAVIWTDNSRFVVRKSLKEISGLLNPEVFVQVHRSHLVNTHHIISIFINDSFIEVADRKIPIGRSFKEPLLDRLQLL